MVLRLESDDFWVAVLAFAVIAVLAVREALKARERTEAWRRFARSLGCEFSFRDPFDTVDTLKHHLFHHGHSRRVTNVMYGEYEGTPIRCFDYRYTIGFGRSSHTLKYTCVLLKSPIPFEKLVIRPEEAGDKIGRLVGVNDVQFESEDFNRQFCVQCQDKRFAFAVLHQRVMEYLMKEDDLALEGAGDALVFYDIYGQSWVNSLRRDTKRLLKFGLGFIELLPRYLQTGSN
ncbi:MAG: DUF3137 domain-containing protein [Armatimonadia bacterium]